jgi:hypothetical protein
MDRAALSAGVGRRHHDEDRVLALGVEERLLSR